MEEAAVQTGGTSQALREEFPGLALRYLTVDAALTIATVETGVPVRALDADRVGVGLGLRLTQPGERLGGGADGLELPEGALVLADEKAAIGLIFGETAAGLGVGRGTKRIA